MLAASQIGAQLQCGLEQEVCRVDALVIALRLELGIGQRSLEACLCETSNHHSVILQSRPFRYLYHKQLLLKLVLQGLGE